MKLFNSWLKLNTSKQEKVPVELNHFVLGTPINNPLETNQDEIIFGCGCFWGAEKGFWKLPGVITTAVGYAGGKDINPTYPKVCSGITGHSEVVRVIWDQSIIDLSDLLKLFWECHDPTQGNRQGNDRGSQYRSVIYAAKNEHLKKIYASYTYYEKQLLSNKRSQITTEIKSDQIFYFAEDYHQQYLAKPGSRPYCSAMPTNIKLGNFEGAEYKLPETVWENFKWEESHCVLRSSNSPIKI